MTVQQISLAMIVCNEGARLAHCLEHVKHAVAEIIIVDTGSTDNTVQIAKQYTDKVYSYAWDNDFAAARNYAIEQTRCEWILSLDADEQLDNAAALSALLEQTGCDAFCLPLCALKESAAACEYDRFMVLRLFRRTYRFKGTIHEYVFLNKDAAIGKAVQPVIWHAAVPTSERYARRGRNITLLKKALTADPANPYLQYYLGTEWLGVRRTDLAIAAFRAALSQLTMEKAVFRSPAVRYLISCYKNSGKFDEALCCCLEESQRYPEYCDLFFEGGVLFELKGEYELAMKWFQVAVKLDPPPLEFFHTSGTEGYLSYYHLGFCAEKLGLYKEAQQYYEQALSANKDYYYPLYQLVLLKLTHQSAAEVLIFLQTQGYLAVPEVAEKMTELFWTAGFPDIGLQCLQQQTAHQPGSLILFTKCLLYSGEAAGALSAIAQMRQHGLLLPPEIAVDEIVSFLMLERFSEAQHRLWNFWQQPEHRNTFRAAFCLYKKLRHNSLLPLANSAAAVTLLTLWDRCLHTRVKNAYEQQRFAAVSSAIKDILANDPATLPLLLSELNNKEQAVKQRLDYTFTALRGLSV